MRGRIVKIWTGDEPPLLVRMFYVAIEGEDTAVNAVLAAHPEYMSGDYWVEGLEGLTSTAIAFSDLREGDILDRSTEEMLNLRKSKP